MKKATTTFTCRIDRAANFFEFFEDGRSIGEDRFRQATSQGGFIPEDIIECYRVILDNFRAERTERTSIQTARAEEAGSSMVSVRASRRGKINVSRWSEVASASREERGEEEDIANMSSTALAAKMSPEKVFLMKDVEQLKKTKEFKVMMIAISEEMGKKEGQRSG